MLINKYEEKKVEDHVESNHGSMNNYENSFQKHEQRRQLLDRDKYRGDFGYSIYNEIDIDCYSPSIYDVYFDDDNFENDAINNDNNESDNVINGVLINKLGVKCKDNAKVFNNFFFLI